VVATTEEGRRLPFPVLQEIYEAYFWFFKRYRNVLPIYFGGMIYTGPRMRILVWISAVDPE
jgi:hypothetical protein